MGSFSIWHWLIVLAVVLLLFGGGGKIPKLMKDMGTGINSFKKGLKDDDKKKAEGDQDGGGGGSDASATEGKATDLEVEASGAEKVTGTKEEKNGIETSS